MNLVFKKGSICIFIMVAVALCYFRFTDSKLYFTLGLCLYVLGLIYHLTFDQIKSKLFIIVFTFFALSAGFGVYYVFYPLKGTSGAYIYLYTVELSWILGFLLIFFKMVTHHPIRLKLSKWSLMVFLVLVINYLFAQKILNFVDAFNLSTAHIVYSFLGTILKMILMSVGVIIYFVGGVKFQKVSFLTGSFIFFFLSDIIATFNSLFFFENQIQGITILSTGLYCLALVFFYIYCITPNKEFEEENTLLV